MVTRAPKNKYRHTLHWKSFLVQPFSVKFCVGKRFFTEFRQWNRYPRSTERISCFPNGDRASASGGFCIVSNTVVLQRSSKVSQCYSSGKSNGTLDTQFVCDLMLTIQIICTDNNWYAIFMFYVLAYNTTILTLINVKTHFLYLI